MEEHRKQARCCLAEWELGDFRFGGLHRELHRQQDVVVLHLVPVQRGQCLPTRAAAMLTRRARQTRSGSNSCRCSGDQARSAISGVNRALGLAP